jgi:hypothetical protein
VGHIHRDLAMAERMGKTDLACEIRWLAAHPASKRLQHPGEYANDNIPAEEAAKEYGLPQTL